jgi:hypothetical protein
MIGVHNHLLVKICRQDLGSCHVPGKILDNLDDLDRDWVRTG